ncbi:cyclopropyl isomerase-like protein [Haematococcus lacustris]
MVSASKPSKWLAINPGKRWTEVFFLLYSPFWIVWALCIIVPFQLYEHAGDWGYMLIGTAAAAPCVILPVLLQSKEDAEKAWHQRYWVKANVWIAIFSFIGNYFWTHYFYVLLGASYTFKSFRLNDVPICLYLMTHAYFCFYHALANVCIRRVGHLFAGSHSAVKTLAKAALVLGLSYATAYGETLTIAHFPYYTFVDHAAMYRTGSLFYALYFCVSFPMFFRIDEAVGAGSQRWSLAACVWDSLAAGMLVTLLLDFWRLGVGGIVDPAAVPNTAARSALPWM